MSRDRRTQAIYALRGKPLNAWECDQTKVLSNNELSDLSCAIGTGLFTSDMTEEEVASALEKIRYGKVVILADSDIDGQHIECLLLGFFFQHMRPLIENGHVYIGLPPLYRITEKGKHIFLKDESALVEFFKNRAIKLIGDDPILIKIAAAATKLKEVIEYTASSNGFSPYDITHALQAVTSYESTASNWVKAFAERIAFIRQGTCENVTVKKFNQDTYIVSGLDEYNRFFTTIVNDTFYNTVVVLWERICDVIEEDVFLSALNGIEFSGKKFSTLYEAVSGIESIIKKGIAIMRAKGLGELGAEELGETTLDRDTRRMIRITVADFSEAGEFLGNMLNTNTVEARRTLVRDAFLDLNSIDA